MNKLNPPIREEYEVALPLITTVQLEATLPIFKKIWEKYWVRRTVILLAIVLIWELFARIQNNSLLFPTFIETVSALYQGILSGELIDKTANSLSVLLQGYFLGIFMAFSLTVLAVSTEIGRDILSTLTSMFNPLPPISLLPLALLWFGLGKNSLIFVLIHSVMWPLAVNTYAGFQAVPTTLRMAGINYGLKGFSYVFQILVPAALPSIIAGLKIGWAFSWRTLIAAELVFGASSGKGGLGWYIFQNRNELYTDKVFAGLALVIIIGLLIESLVFETIEKLTIRRWGTQR